MPLCLPVLIIIMTNIDRSYRAKILYTPIITIKVFSLHRNPPKVFIAVFKRCISNLGCLSAKNEVIVKRS